MKNKFFNVLSLLLIISLSGYSQLEEKIKNENVVAGTITKEGKEIQGYFKKTGIVYLNDKIFLAPWKFQSTVEFIEKDVFENTEKIKNKLFKEYSAKELESYKYETLYYESVKYADMSAVGLGMIPKKMFMRKIKDGKITLFHFFSSPPEVLINESIEPYYIESGTPQLVYRKDLNGKLKLVNNLDIEKELADCPYVTEKQKNGEYKTIGKDGESKSDFQKIVNNTLFKEQVRSMAIEDYNSKCN
ncbi:MAG: hypothetical protein K2Q03_06525 [Sphingobacteriaceae bacterium]|nr:hypothetical protein [Sphingobacteriaceae bacterium]